ncbi:MAG: VPLPA-CTERM sorting domain-containing protein [Pseudomonadota bacterium]
MKKFRITISLLSLTLLFNLGLALPSFASSYYSWDGPNKTQWSDANKTWHNDYNMCWAAAASNILAWGGWGTQELDTAGAIFTDFKQHWTNEGSTMYIGWQWWLNGVAETPGDDWSRLRNPGDPGGGHWKEGYQFEDYLDWTFGAQALRGVDSFLHDGYGVTLAVCKQIGQETYGHALTVWGYDYSTEADQYYTSLWVTDSDDGRTGLASYQLTWDPDTESWWLGGQYHGWYIAEVQALGQRPTPVPAALLLFASGLAGLGEYGRRRFSRKT